MDISKLFNKYKFLIITLIITYIIFIICYWKSAMGLFFDIPAMFSVIFYDHSSNPDKLQFLQYIQPRIRFFTNFIVAIPVNIFMPLIKNQPALTGLKLYSTSYFIIHFIFLITNILVSKRTKRYDIAIIALFFYFIFSVPNAIWAVREIHIAMLAYFIILNYFLTRERLNWFDAIIILLIQTYLFESFETSTIYGLIIFIASIIFIKNESLAKNKIHKILIGITSLGIFLYIPIKLIIWNIIGKLNLSSGTSEWLSHSELAIKNLFTSNLLIPFFAICGLILLCIYKKQLNNKVYLCGVFYVVLTLLITYIQTNFTSRPLIELVNYSPIFWFLFPTITLVLIFEYLKININNKIPNFYEYMLITTCIFGILNLTWQIKSTADFCEYKQYLINIMDKTESTIIKIPDKDFDNLNILRYATCYGLSTQSIFLLTKEKPAKIIIPQKTCIIYNNDCADNVEKTHYNPEKKHLRIQDSFINIKTKYWDLTPIKEEFIKEKRIFIDKT